MKHHLHNIRAMQAMTGESFLVGLFTTGLFLAVCWMACIAEWGVGQ